MRGGQCCLCRCPCWPGSLGAGRWELPCCCGGGGGGGGTLSLQFALLRVSAPSLQARSLHRELPSLAPSDRGLTAACRFFALFSVFRFSSFAELVWTNNLFSWERIIVNSLVTGRQAGRACFYTFFKEFVISKFCNSVVSKRCASVSSVVYF